jgi:hypothetical protein
VVRVKGAPWIIVGAILLSTVVAGSLSSRLASSAQAQEPPDLGSGGQGVPAPEVEEDFNSLCFLCHGEPDRKTTLPSGETLPLYVSQESFEGSVHGDLECIACHPSSSASPFASRR